MIPVGRPVSTTRVAPTALAALVGRPPPMPGEVVTAIGVYEAQLAFERIVRELWPAGDTARAILDARRPGERRETTRVWAFVERCEADYFPLQPCEEYAEIVGEVPIYRFGLTYDEVEAWDGRTGHLLLVIAVLGGAMPGLAAHCDFLREEAHVTDETLALILADQREPAALDAALVGTPYAATGDLARWLYGDTGSCFLDATWEMQVIDNEDWTPGIVATLTAQWRAAETLMGRVDALATLLEADSDAHFAALLRAVGAIRQPAGAGEGWADPAERAPASPGGPGNASATAPDRQQEGDGDGADRAPRPGRVVLAPAPVGEAVSGDGALAAGGCG